MTRSKLLSINNKQISLTLNNDIMDLSNIPIILSIVQFCFRIFMEVKNIFKKTKTRSKSRYKPRKQTKEEELINDLFTNPELAVKKIIAEHVVKNRSKIISGLVDSVSGR
ncbi:MAG: hypothetical protein E6L00_00515 [Thaumarchaeota archaeon]|nr:MAG: hypothetical protein E6L00_00515 [Nitrososphaerota archaeon]